MNNVEEQYNTLMRKHSHTVFIYALLNITSFLFSSALIVLNLFAIRFNPLNGTDNIWGQLIFIVITILISISSFVLSAITLFLFKSKAKRSLEKIELMQQEKRQHQRQIDAYANEKRDKTLVKKITDIKNS